LAFTQITKPFPQISVILEVNRTFFAKSPQKRAIKKEKSDLSGTKWPIFLENRPEIEKKFLYIIGWTEQPPKKLVCLRVYSWEESPESV